MVRLSALLSLFGVVGKVSNSIGRQDQRDIEIPYVEICRAARPKGENADSLARPSLVKMFLSR